MAESVLKIENLRIESVAGHVLVDDVSLELKRGEVLGLIGESGAGKSTIGLASMVYARAGCKITGGKVIVDGESARDLSADDRRELRGRRIAYIAQSAAASFNPAHRIISQVCEMPIKHGIMTKPQAKAWAIELFKALDLPNPEKFGERYPHQVSGGQLQRAMTAMAMSCRPDILVFDEPTTALDVTTQIEVLALIRKLIHEYQTAALYISHDLAVVAQVADRIMVLRGGKMVELGTTEQILQAPKTEYARALVSERKEADKLNVLEEIDEGKSLLYVKDAVGAYENFIAVKNISISVAKGETVAVVGESGSGKSSLARLILGLLARKSGSVKFNGRELLAGPQGTQQGRSAPHPVHLSAARRGAQSAPEGGRDHRPAGAALFRPFAGGGEAPGGRAAGAGRACRSIMPGACRRRSPAARNSASRLPARSPPSRTSSSAMNPPRRSTSWSPMAC